MPNIASVVNGELKNNGIQDKKKQAGDSLGKDAFMKQGGSSEMKVWTSGTVLNLHHLKFTGRTATTKA